MSLTLSDLTKKFENNEKTTLNGEMVTEPRADRTLHYLKMVNLLEYKNFPVHQISGGMKQRVALARALSMDSEVLLMDEPFSALDKQTSNVLREELQRIWVETGKTVLFITHSVEEAVYLADRVVVMHPRKGKISRIYPVDIERPRHVYTDEFVSLRHQILEDVMHVFHSYSVPSPIGVAERFLELCRNGSLHKATICSLVRGMEGFLIAAMIGIMSGFLIYHFKYLQKNLKPVVMGIQTLPSVCWVPFSILWFGLSNKAIIFVVIMGSAFSIAISVDNALKNISNCAVAIRQTICMQFIAMQMSCRISNPFIK